MTNYHLANSQFMLPFSHRIRAAAEDHNATLGGKYTVVPVEAKDTESEDDEWGGYKSYGQQIHEEWQDRRNAY